MTITHDNDNVPQQVEDQIVKKVMAKYYERSQVGIKKYGKTLDRGDLSLYDWLNHLQEEIMDASLYIEKIKEELKKIKPKDVCVNYEIK